MTSCDRKMLRLLILGNDKVGKTAILNQYCNRKFIMQYEPTIGAKFSVKELDVDDWSVSLNIWDMAGTEKFRSLTQIYSRRTDCCILAYDVTNPQSFENIKNWKKVFSESLGLSDSDDFPFLLLGNKSDLPGKAVEEITARLYAINNGNMLFYEVSSKTGENIQEAFISLVKKYKKLHMAKELEGQMRNQRTKFEEQMQRQKNEFEAQMQRQKNEFGIFVFVQILNQMRYMKLMSEQTTNQQYELEKLKEDVVNQRKLIVKTGEEHKKQIEEIDEEHKKQIEEIDEEFLKQLDEKNKEIERLKEQLKLLQMQITTSVT